MDILLSLVYLNKLATTGQPRLELHTSVHNVW